MSVVKHRFNLRSRAPVQDEVAKWFNGAAREEDEFGIKDANQLTGVFIESLAQHPRGIPVILGRTQADIQKGGVVQLQTERVRVETEKAPSAPVGHMRALMHEDVRQLRAAVTIRVHQPPRFLVVRGAVALPGTRVQEDEKYARLGARVSLANPAWLGHVDDSRPHRGLACEANPTACGPAIARGNFLKPIHGYPSNVHGEGRAPLLHASLSTVGLDDEHFTADRPSCRQTTRAKPHTALRLGPVFLAPHRTYGGYRYL